MFKVTSKGDYPKTNSFLRRGTTGGLLLGLDFYGRRGVDALRSATPVDSGLTAASWKYRIIKLREGARIEWYNTNQNGSEIIAILIQYGHGTGTGGYVPGRDYINPAIRPVFDGIIEDIGGRLRNG